MKPSYEQTDIPIRRLLWVVLAFGALAAVIHLGLWLLQDITAKSITQELGGRIAPPTAPSPPKPRIQIKPKEDLQSLRARHEKLMNSYGWVNREAGVVRVPVDRAMDLSLKKGFPVQTPTPAREPQSLETKAFKPVGVPPEVRFEQNLGESIPRELLFRDEQGNPLRLSELLDEMPMILVFSYYRCPNLCSAVLNGLSESLQKLNLTLGEQFRIVSVSIDPEDKPEVASAKKTAYLKRYGRSHLNQTSLSGWRFLTGEASAIGSLTEAAGFHFAFDNKTRQYLHPGGIVILTPEGRISRYFMGIQYSARDLRLSLVEASGRRIGTLTDQVMLFCFEYDPQNGKYGPSILKMLRLMGIVTAIFLIGAISWDLARERKRRRRP